MPSRFEFERAIRHSELPAPARHLALTIATWADVKSGRIPARMTPSLTTLAEATGLGRSTVQRQLNCLEEDGWVARDRPDPVAARTQQARTKYRLRIPKGAVVEEAEEETTKAHSDPRPTAGLGDLGAERAQGRRTADPDLGPERDVPRPTAGHKSSYGPKSSFSAPANGAPQERTNGTLFDVEEPPKPVTAQTVIAEWVSRIGHTPTRNTIERVGAEAKKLLDQGQSFDVIVEALVDLSKDKYAKSPSSLPQHVDKVLARRANVVQMPTNPNTRGGSHHEPPTNEYWDTITEEDLENIL